MNLLNNKGDQWLPLTRKSNPLVSQTALSQPSLKALKELGYEKEGRAEFFAYELPELPSDFGIGVIIGGSGSGKTTLLKEFGEVSTHEWDKRAILDHFETAEDAMSKLFAVGLTSVPTWIKPYQALSNGEKFRADLAINMKSGAVIDEYTSVVDRNIAKAASKSLRNYVSQKRASGIVIATVHKDIISYLKPDWVINTDSGSYCLDPQDLVKTETLVAEVFEVNHKIWKHYSKHHYLTEELHKGAKCFIAVINGEPAGFGSVLRMPHPTVLHAWRGHRLVVQPDYQGLGLGTRFSDWIGELYVNAGQRYFSQTAHPRLGGYRQNSEEWRATTMNLKMRGNAERYEKIAQRRKSRDVFTKWIPNGSRLMFSHEFMGKTLDQE